MTQLVKCPLLVGIIGAAIAASCGCSEHRSVAPPTTDPASQDSVPADMQPENAPASQEVPTAV